MEIVKKIRLLDGSEHETKQRATTHLFSILSSGSDLELFDSLSNLSSLKVKNFFIDNSNKIESTLQIIRELKEVDNTHDKYYLFVLDFKGQSFENILHHFKALK